MDLVEFKKLYRNQDKYKYLSDRCFDLSMQKIFLQGKIYDVLKYPFFKTAYASQQLSYSMGGSESLLNGSDYIKMSERRPAVKHAIAQTTVDKSVSLLFGEGRFPIIDHEDEKTENLLNDLVKSIDLEWHMLDCATKGSIGSGILFLKIIDSKIYVSTDWSCYYTPFFKKNNPNELEKVVYKCFMIGYEINALNLDGVKCDDKEMYVFFREWNEQEELLYRPIKVSEYEKMTDKNITKLEIVKKESVFHGLGFVPIVWIKNLPGGDGVDGQSTFEKSIDDIIELDYQMSQGGRGLKYSAEPLLVVNTSSVSAEANMAPLSPGEILVLDENGGAKYSEISGDACRAVLEYCKQLKDLAIENIHGDRTNPEKMHTMQSGKAMEMLQMSLVWLAGKLRLSYGEYGLKTLLNMIIKVNQSSDLFAGSKIVGKNALKNGDLNLKWSKWFDSTGSDRLQDSQSLSVLKTNGLISTKTALSSISAEYDISDLNKEISEISKEKEDNEKNQMELSKVNLNSKSGE